MTLAQVERKPNLIAALSSPQEQLVLNKLIGDLHKRSPNMVAPNSLERQPVKRCFFHALNLIHRVPYFYPIMLNTSLSAEELRGGGGGGTLDEYKIVKTMKHTCLVVTLYVCYKLTQCLLLLSETSIYRLVSLSGFSISKGCQWKNCNRATKESIIYQKWTRDSAPSQIKKRFRPPPPPPPSKRAPLFPPTALVKVLCTFTFGATY